MPPAIQLAGKFPESHPLDRECLAQIFSAPADAPNVTQHALEVLRKFREDAEARSPLFSHRQAIKEMREALQGVADSCRHEIKHGGVIPFDLEDVTDVFDKWEGVAK